MLSWVLSLMLALRSSVMTSATKVPDGAFSAFWSMRLPRLVTFQPRALRSFSARSASLMDSYIRKVLVSPFSAATKNLPKRCRGK